MKKRINKLFVLIPMAVLIIPSYFLYKTRANNNSVKALAEKRCLRIFNADYIDGLDANERFKACTSDTMKIYKSNPRLRAEDFCDAEIAKMNFGGNDYQKAMEEYRAGCIESEIKK